MKKKILTFLLLCGSMSVNAQNEFGTAAPQSVDFIRHEQIPVSLYTGQASVSIPLVHVQDRDFDIPLTLRYSADGLKPNRRHGWVGMNWSLSGVGTVTREVYYAPDDFKSWTAPNGVNIKGMWQAVQQRTYAPSVLFDLTPLQSSGNSLDLPPTTDGLYDCNPDLFLFAMPGHTGRFMIGNQGEVLTSDPNYQIDLSGLSMQTSDSYTLPSQIRITAPDGYIYTFGNSTDLSPLEYSFGFHPSTSSQSFLTKASINAWHLTQIQAPNGRVLKLNYLLDSGDDQLPMIRSTCQRKTTGVDPGDPFSAYSYMATKGIQLESIEIVDTGLKIEFTSGTESCRSFYYNTIYDGKYNSSGRQLESVRVKQGDTTLYTCSLEYENQGQFRFLKQVTVADGGVYAMEYQHTTYPEPLTTDVDVYGYWTAHLNTPYGLLSKLTYPTKGYTNFVYELQRYSRIVEKSVSGGTYSSRNVSQNGSLNTFRVMRIGHYPNQGADFHQSPKITEYIYADQSGASTGTLLKSCMYIVRDNGQALQTSEWKDNYNVDEPLLGYSLVKECFSDGSYTEYRFSDYADNPDNGGVNFRWKSGSGIPSVLPFAFAHSTLAVSHWDSRGQLQQKKVYDADGSLKQTSSYVYHKVSTNFPIIDEGESSPANQEPYAVAVRPIEGGAMALKLNLDEHPLLQVIETEYTGNGSRKTMKRYIRDSYGLVSEQRELLSDGDTLYSNYIYPRELASTAGAGSAYATMVSRNQVARPMVERVHRNNAPSDIRRKVPKVTSSGLVVIDTLSVGREAASVRSTEYYPVYDSYGNPVEVVGADGRRQILIWGYKGRYLVARVEGATYNGVQSALGVTPESLSSADNPDMTSLDALRSALPEALVTTYTYTPHVGMTSMTKPNGEKTTYVYNSVGELSHVKDHDECVTVRYTKHYRTEQ